jgi:hypothetical protein
MYEALAHGFVTKVANAGLALKILEGGSQTQLRREDVQFYMAPVCARTVLLPVVALPCGRTRFMACSPSAMNRKHPPCSWL